MSDFDTAIDAVDTFDLTPLPGSPGVGDNVMFCTPCTFHQLSKVRGGGVNVNGAVEYGKTTSRIFGGDNGDGRVQKRWL